MADETPPASFDRDFEAIEAAVLETERGRWFLAEFARRNRVAETDKLLGAIQRLGHAADPPGEDDAQRLRADLLAIADTIETARAEIEVLGAGEDHKRVSPDARGFDRIVDSAETAAATIMDAAERIQEAAWTLREQGATPRVCDDLDRRATQIFAACAFQDLAAQRYAKLSGALAAVDERVASLSGRWGATRRSTPRAIPAPEPQLSRDDIDFVFVDGGDADRDDAPENVVRPPSPTGRPIPRPGPACAEDGVARPNTLAEIDALTMRERLRLFT